MNSKKCKDAAQAQILLHSTEECHAARMKVSQAKRIVIKVGTSTLTYPNGKLNLSKIDHLAKVLSDLVNQGHKVTLVTSGAIGIGAGKLKLKDKPKTTREKQAAAAVGQCELMHIYSKMFAEYGYNVGQILLTKDVIDDPGRRQNVMNTFDTLMEFGIIPIVNENDSISIEEIEKIVSFGDNDTLSAYVSRLVKADLLILLSDIDGLYDGNPTINPDATLIPIVWELTPDIECCAGGAGTKRGTGGMVTKISAARIACDHGIDMVITNGANPEIIYEILEGKDIGTLFVSRNN